MSDLIIKRLDQLDNKLDKLESKVDKLESKVDKLESKVDGNHQYLTDMMAQLMRIVGETNRKVSDIFDKQDKFQTDFLKVAATTELHKRKIADIEETVFQLQHMKN